MPTMNAKPAQRACRWPFVRREFFRRRFLKMMT
jgi:hypothetical protein